MPFASRVEEAYFIGYSTTSNCYRIWHKDSIKETIDFKFVDIPSIQVDDSQHSIPPTPVPNTVVEEPVITPHVKRPLESINDSDNDNNESESVKRRSTRLKKYSTKFNDYYVSVTEVTDGTETLYCLVCGIDGSPTTVREALESEDRDSWILALKVEYDTNVKNKVFEIVKRPENQNIICYKLVFAKKVDSLGNILKFKARLCANGMNPVYGVDYDHSYAPVAKLVTSRVLLSIVCACGYILVHADVIAAFQNNHGLSDTICMEIPEIYKQLYDLEEDAVFQLLVAINATKQAA